MNTENRYYARIEELETALENLLECFERTSTSANPGGRPWIEVEVETDFDSEDSMIITVGQVNQHTADAVEFAEKVLWDEGRVFDAEDEE